MTAPRNLAAELDQDALVEDYLTRHPYSTVVAVRDGIQAETGSRIERVQRAIGNISKRRVVHKRPAEHNRVAYALGDRRAKQKLAGIEATVVLVDGDVKVEVWAQKPDLKDPKVAALVDALVVKLRAILDERVAPLALVHLVEEPPESNPDEGPQEDDGEDALEARRAWHDQEDE